MWRSIAVVWLLWTVSLFLASLANFYDLRNQGSQSNLQAQLWKFLLLLLPWPLLSSGLIVYFSRLPSKIAWQQVGRIFLFLVLVFLPVHVIYEHTVYAFRIYKHQPDWLEIMQLVSPLQIWVDVMLLLFTLSAHLAVNYWQRSQQQLMMASHSRQQVLALKLVQLRAHLEPYFLLSALEGIENLLISAERPMATRALARLSDLLRYVLASSQETELSIADEFGFLKDYLSLQNLGFGNHLQTTWSLEERDWSAAQIPPLLLYPLFDYAIRNMQAALRVAQGSMRIRAEIVECVLSMSVDFSGDAKQTMLITEELEALQQRLELLHGSKASIRFLQYQASAALPHGVELRFPLTEMSDA